MNTDALWICRCSAAVLKYSHLSVDPCARLSDCWSCSPPCVLKLPSYLSVSLAWLEKGVDVVQKDGQTDRHTGRRPLAEAVRRSQTPMPQVQLDSDQSGFRRLWRPTLFCHHCLKLWRCSHCTQEVLILIYSSCTWGVIEKVMSLKWWHTSTQLNSHQLPLHLVHVGFENILDFVNRCSIARVLDPLSL